MLTRYILYRRSDGMFFNGWRSPGYPSFSLDHACIYVKYEDAADVAEQYELFDLAVVEIKL